MKKHLVNAVFQLTDNKVIEKPTMVPHSMPLIQIDEFKYDLDDNNNNDKIEEKESINEMNYIDKIQEIPDPNKLIKSGNTDEQQLLPNIINNYYKNIYDEDYKNILFLKFPINDNLDITIQTDHMKTLLEECSIRYFKYKKWLKELPEEPVYVNDNSDNNISKVEKIYKDYNSKIDFYYNDINTLLLTMIDSVAYECIDTAIDLKLNPPPPTPPPEVVEPPPEEIKVEEEEKEEEKKNDKSKKKGKEKEKVKTPKGKSKKGKGKEEPEPEEKEEIPNTETIKPEPVLKPAKSVPVLPLSTQKWVIPKEVLDSYATLNKDESIINLLPNDHVEYMEKSKVINERNEILKSIIENNLDIREKGINNFNLYENNYLDKMMHLIEILPIPGFSYEKFPPDDTDKEKMGIYFTKLYYFSKIPILDMKLNDIIFEFERYMPIIDPNVKNPWNFSNRHYIEYLDKQCLPQVINNLYKKPLSLYLKYLPQYDIILLIKHYVTPHNKFNVIKETTLPFSEARLPTFQEYYNYIIENGDNEFPIKYKMSQQSTSDNNEHKFIFPSDHSVIEFKSENINVNYINLSFGIKPTQLLDSQSSDRRNKVSSTFYINFDDNSSLFIDGGDAMPNKFDGFDSISMIYYEMNGCEYNITSNGKIIIKSVKANKEMNENYREFIDDGEMNIVYNNGKIMSFHKDGSITLSDTEEKLTVFEDGRQLLEKGDEEDEIDPIDVFKYEDNASNCSICARRNVFGDSITTEYKNSEIIRTIYNDKTNIFYDKENEIKYIYHPLYGTVKLFSSHNEVCLKHQNGIKCPMKNSGIFPRYECYTYDGTKLTMNYDTRVTAKFNGELECLRYDKTLIKGNDSGIIELIYGKNSI